MVAALIAFLFAVLPACPTEDSGAFCKWDATIQGDGNGASFVVIADHVFYVETL